MTAVADHPDRVVALGAVHNFRDLGGYTTTSGATVAWRRLFRADGLGRLDGDDLDIVASLGLRTVVDLRTPQELDARGRFPADRHPVAYHHVSIIDQTWAPDDGPQEGGDAEFLVWAYRQMLADGGGRFAEAIVALAAPGALPAVFHCAAGKDRTGLLAMLVLGALDVEHEHIVADYALTNAAIHRLRRWVATEEPEIVERMASVPQVFFSADPEAMRVIVADLTAAHGSLAGYVREIGVPAEAIQHLRSELLTR
jgi:protein-tyrosine phosphatase